MKSLTKIFGKFAGKEIQTVNKPITFHGKTYDNYVPVDNEPTIAAIKQAAKDNKIDLRLWTPGMMGTCDVQPTRLNIHIRSDKDGKWRVHPDLNTVDKD